MGRFNIYDLPHKALRNALSQFNTQSGNTDYTNELELGRLKLNLLRLMSLLSSHSYIEDAHIIQKLEAKGISSFEKDKSDHHELDELIFNISRGIQKVSHESESANELGREIYMQFNYFQGKYLLHMYHEETVSLPTIWANLNDDEIFAIREVIMKKTPAKIMQDWFYYCLPAQKRQERIMIFKGLKAGDQILFSNTLDTASKVLSDQEMEDILVGVNA